ncbi:MAG: WYL domain-containing protein [Syntrophaceae bacterium]|nr:WYL domain-containing protein [Syntrophaceae bacterium]
MTLRFTPEKSKWIKDQIQHKDQRLKLLKDDDLVKSLERPFSVIPAHAGIQYFHVVRIPWIPVPRSLSRTSFTGMTTFYDSIKEGFLEISFPVSDFSEIKREILKDGDAVTVIKPESLRDLIKTEAQKIAKIY